MLQRAELIFGSDPMLELLARIVYVPFGGAFAHAEHSTDFGM
jgi:hypothetical protein